MRSMPFHVRLMAACLSLSGIAFSKPVIQVTGDHDGFVLSGYTYKVAAQGTSEIELSLSDADSERLAQLSTTKFGGHVMVTIGGTEILMPVVRNVIPGKQLKLTFVEPSIFEAVKAVLPK